MKFQCIKDRKKNFIPCCIKVANLDNNMNRNVSFVWITATNTWFSCLLLVHVAWVSLNLALVQRCLNDIQVVFGLLEAKPNHRFQSDSKVQAELYNLKYFFHWKKFRSMKGKLFWEGSFEKKLLLFTLFDPLELWITRYVYLEEKHFIFTAQ